MVLNPSASTLMVYEAGLRAVKMYRPTSSVTTVSETWVAGLVMVMVTFGTTAPVESLTVPRN